MTEAEAAPPSPAHPLRQDEALVERLTLLGRALGNPVRVRIAAALLQLDEAGPKDLATIIDDKLGNVSYHVRCLNDLGFIRLERLIPRRGAIEHKYSLGEPLRRALPAAALALSRDAERESSESPTEGELLGYLLQHDHATATEIAEGLAITKGSAAKRLRILADSNMVACDATPSLCERWTVTPQMKKTLAGLYDLLMVSGTGAPLPPGPAL